MEIAPAGKTNSKPSTLAAAIDPEADDDSTEPEEPLVEPTPGTPEWLIREITRIQSAPLDVVRTPTPGKPGEFQVVDLTDQQAEAEEMRRAEKVVGLALEVCAKTKDRADQLLLFNNAIHYLANGRVTLAAYGDHEQLRLLGEEAEMLYQRDPKSFSALEMQLKLVECLAELAEQDGRKNDSWGKMAAVQARLFASRFPQETNRCGLALVSAARACEVGGRFDDARQCFALLERDFVKTPFAEQAAGAIRRYKLAGQPIGEFAGATIDGGFLSIDEYRGRPVLIVFWSAESPSFREDLPRLKQLIDTRAERAMAVVGVNMDVDEAAVDSFIEQAEITWRTIFFSNIEQRGIRNPLARAYGVTSVPQYWLVDPQGKVVAAPVDLKSLETRFSQIARQPEGPATR
jgi:peroxiredoxin